MKAKPDASFRCQLTYPHQNCTLTDRHGRLSLNSPLYSMHDTPQPITDRLIPLGRIKATITTLQLVSFEDIIHGILNHRKYYTLKDKCLDSDHLSSNGTMLHITTKLDYTETFVSIL
jgi:hypothetical protein